MARFRSSLPDDVSQFINLIRTGKLFASQEWINQGKRIRVGLALEFCFLLSVWLSGNHHLVEGYSAFRKAAPFPNKSIQALYPASRWEWSKFSRKIPLGKLSAVNRS
jgi:hypothetical protein